MDTRALRNAFWRDLGAGSLALLLAAVFFIFAPIGLLIDVLTLGRQPAGEVLYTTLLSGGVAALYLWCVARARRWIPLAVAFQLALTLLAPRLFPDTPAADAAARTGRVTFDVVGVIVSLTLGYVLFVIFIMREGIATVQLRTEMVLAREIHQSLVPPVERRIGALDLCGVSIPSGAVGGDLVDVVESPGGTWTGYVADVSGHGVPAGLLMGMVRSAVRTRLLAPTPLPALLADLNRIVVDARRPNMFATFAAVRGDAAGPLEFTLAGHLPLLRLRRGATTVEQLSVPQIPLGILEDYPFTSAPLTCEPGDLLALVTDGLSEVFDRHDQELGLAGLEAVLLATANQPLPAIRDALLARATAHGPQLDDRTVLLIRV